MKRNETKKNSLSRSKKKPKKKKKLLQNFPPLSSTKKARAFVVNAVLFYSYESLIELMGGRDPADASESLPASSSSST